METPCSWEPGRRGLVRVAADDRVHQERLAPSGPPTGRWRLELAAALLGVLVGVVVILAVVA